MKSPSRCAGATRSWFVLALACMLAAGVWFWRSQSDEGSAITYRTTTVARGSITASVSATGTLNPVTSVQVGSQVSGQIKEVLADFNSVVRQGQLIAQIDPQTFQSRVRQAQADLDTARAQVLTAQANVNAARASVSRAQVNHAEARRDLGRKQQLLDRSFISPAELDKARVTVNATGEDVKAAEATLQVAMAQVRSSQAVARQREAQLAQAKIDLERTAIRAPIDGIVIKRSVDAGQTVAATLQSPELFVLARDLGDMQVDTSIDEAEIGRVREGQDASFTVDAFPGRSFRGKVMQVRKAATTVQNVVTYVVVVSARNPDLSLVPGMTANVRIVTETRESVLKVPNAALRFRPPGFREPVKSAAPGTAVLTPASAALPSPASATGAFSAVAATALSAAADLVLPAAHAQAPAPSGRLAQLKAQLVTELALTAEQQQQLDEIFASMRDQFIALRSAPQAERAKRSERTRTEMRERISTILTPAQRERYAELVARSAGRQASRGRVFLLDDKGSPRPVQVRIGISDGSFTEVSGDGISEGDKVITGVVAPGGTGTSPGSRSSGPRLPF